MKLLLGMILLTVTVTVRAERIVPMVFNLTAKASVQGDGSNGGGYATTNAPTVYKLTTATALEALAAAEHYNGHWPQSTFPDGAKLVWLNYTDDFASSHFVVTDANLNQICDVSDVLTWDADIPGAVSSGQSTTGSPSLMTGAKQTYLISLNFDDTKAGGGQNLNLYFLVQSQLNDTLDRSGIAYTETIKSKLVNGIGNGTYYGRNVVLTGSAKASGRASIPF